MQIRVLGCSGGLSDGLRTTSLLVNDDILVDAGTGVGDLTIDEMARIRHVFLTHSHLDHVASIPLLLDSLFDRISEPVTVHALPETVQALKDHIFNWTIWPDFAALPSPEKPLLRYAPMNPGEVRTLDGCKVEMVAVNHIVPGVGYCLSGENGVFAYSGDTTTNDTFWAHLDGLERLDMLMVEVAYPNREVELSRIARHYCPSLLADDLAKLHHRPKVYLSHLKPGDEATIIAECHEALSGHEVEALRQGMVFKL